MRKKYTFLTLLTFLMVAQTVYAQTESPYETSFKKDAPLVAAGLGLSYLGLTLIKNKKDLTLAEVALKSKDDVFFIDRFAAGNYSQKADDDSYIPFYGSFAIAPLVALIDKNQRSHYGQV